MTTLVYVSDALKLLGVINESETPSPEQGADGVRALNDMMMYYAELGFDCGYNPQSSTADSFTPPAGEREAIKYLLAARLASSYGIDVPPVAALIAAEANDRWRRKGVLTRMVPITPSLPLGEGFKNYSWNIETGT